MRYKIYKVGATIYTPFTIKEGSGFCPDYCEGYAETLCTESSHFPEDTQLMEHTLLTIMLSLLHALSIDISLQRGV